MEDDDDFSPKYDHISEKLFQSIKTFFTSNKYYDIVSEFIPKIHFIFFKTMNQDFRGSPTTSRES